MVYKLSPSAISSMEDCSRCFWLHHNEKKKRPDAIFPSLSSGMDNILKMHIDKFRDKNELHQGLKENGDCKKRTI